MARVASGAVFLLWLTCTLYAGSTRSERTAETLRAVPDLEVYHSNETLCGVASIYCALDRLGRSQPFHKTVEALDPGHTGVSFKDMCRYLDELDVEHCAVRIEDPGVLFRCLKPGVRNAVLHVDDGSHFLLALRRCDGALAAMDGREVIHHNVREKVASRYSRSALIIGSGAKRTLLLNSLGWRIVAIFIAVIVGAVCGAWAGTTIRSKGAKRSLSH